MSIQGSPKKIRLRPLTTSNSVKDALYEETISKNLEPLLINTEKKRRAQDAFYKNKVSVSPMIRQNRPVKHRLGLPNGTNTSSFFPKLKLRRHTQNNPISNRKVNIAQQRLNMIRTNQRRILSTSTHNQISLQKKVYKEGPRNFQISVKNTSSQVFLRQPRIKRFRQILSPSLQKEIHHIQDTYVREEILIPMRITPVTTKISMHNRFMMLV